jgi:hypothetical protein
MDYTVVIEPAADGSRAGPGRSRSGRPHGTGNTRPRIFLDRFYPSAGAFMKTKFLNGSLVCLAIIVGAVAVQRGVAGADDSATTKPTTAPAVVAWTDAAKHVGETVTITGPVISTHKITGGKSVSLNIGKDYPATDRFTIFLTTDKPDEAATSYKDKTVTVTGKVVLYKKVPEIKVSEKDLKVEP